MTHQVTELHNIMPLVNIPSVLQRGILSNALANRLEHRDISLPDIQERRDNVQVPGGLKLHSYANLYFHARNPMMSRRRNEVNNLCVLCVSTAVLEIPNTVITDQNASSKYVRFYAPTDVRLLPLDRIYAESWIHPDDQIAQWRHSSQKCAEVLVPHCVPPAYIFGAYVVNQHVQTALTQAGFPHPVEINPHLFFR